MSSWADQSDDIVPLEQAPPEYTGGSGVRPRLHLKPRSVSAAAQDPYPSGGGSNSRSNPFGAAKPREEVLASKGIDASLVDKRVERKANVPRLTADQDRQVEALRAELTGIEEKLREANEMELPEEDLRVAAEGKRSELNELVKGFHEMNLKERNAKEMERTKRDSGGTRGGGVLGGLPQRKFERPSERRRRLEQQRREVVDHHRGGGQFGDDYYDEDEEDQYTSFGNNRNRPRVGVRGGRGGGGAYHGDHSQIDHRVSRGGGGYSGDRHNRDGYSNDRYGDRGGAGSGGGYNDYGNGGNHSGDGGGGRRSSGSYNDKYAGDRYNY